MRLAAIATFALLSSCLRVDSTDAAKRPLDVLSVPPALRLRVGHAALSQGDLPRALELIRSAPHPESEVVIGVLSELADVSLVAGSERIALEALSELERRRPQGPGPRAVALRVADGAARDLADRQSVDRQVRQLLADLARRDPALALPERERLCTHLEGLYWDRFRRASEPAYQIDALLAVRSVCQRDAPLERVLESLTALAREAEAAGRSETAVAFLEQVIELASRHGGRSPSEIEASRRAVRRLLWPTYLARARTRFARRFAVDWADRGLYQPDDDVVRVEVAVEVAASCGLEGNDCPDLWRAAESALRERLAAVALEAAETPASVAQPATALGAVTPELVNRTDRTAYFAATVALEQLVRAVYDAQTEQDP